MIRSSSWVVVTSGFLATALAACSGAPEEATGDADDAIVTHAPDGGTSAESRTAAHMDAIKSNAGQLTAFLVQVPKGGDLHHHLSGAVYAETYLGWASAASDCLETASGQDYLAISASCTTASQKDVPIPATTDPLYTQAVEGMSMLNFVPTATSTGHDHFFSTFIKYAAMSNAAHHGVSLADVETRAASENELYIEPMLVSNSIATSVGSSVWTADHGSMAMTTADFATFRTQLLAATSWPSVVNDITSDVSVSESKAQTTLGCSGATPPAACGVTTRYQVYISRSGAAPSVFAEMVAAYEAAMVEPRVVALNLVGPEDGFAALKNYDLQMSMLQYLRGVYAGKSPLKLALHAGELADAFMPSGFKIGTVDHITKAVEIAGANRIGHGVDIEEETSPASLLSELAAKKVLVEVCLSSNTQILGVSGTTHPLAKYLAAGVPVALATDDQGVSRTSIAGEYVRAVTDQKLEYLDLKQLSRNSLEYSFLPGESLFVDFTSRTIATACADAADETVTTDVPTAACATYLGANAKAKVEWELERRYRTFESQF